MQTANWLNNNLISNNLDNCNAGEKENWDKITVRTTQFVNKLSQFLHKFSIIDYNVNYNGIIKNQLIGDCVSHSWIMNNFHGFLSGEGRRLTIWAFLLGNNVKYQKYPNIWGHMKTFNINYSSVERQYLLWQYILLPKK